MLKDAKLVDLSRRLEENMPTAPSHPHYFHCLWNAKELGESSKSYLMSLHEHCGTHVDATSHFFSDNRARAIDDYPLSDFMAPCCVIQCVIPSGESFITRAHIEAWEQVNGLIHPGEAVLFYTGWARYWGLRPDNGDYLKDWPGLSYDAAAYLVEKGCGMVGTDAFSIDAFTSADFPAHNTLLGAGLLILECLKELDNLPPHCYLLALPLAIKDGSASPVRAVAICGE
jgi:kynurenine formamidase